MSGEIFTEPWWLEATAPGSWREVSVEENGARLAEMRFLVKRERFGFVRIGGGPMSPRIGPNLLIPDAKVTTRIGRENEIVARLIAALPRYDYLSLTLPPRVTNWLPFHWLGFRQTTRYSYILDGTTDEDRGWRGMSEATRRAIRKAERSLSVESADAATLHRLTDATFRRQGLKTPYTADSLRRASSAATQRGRGAILAARDGDGRVAAGALFVWDDERSYYLVGGSNPELRSSGAMSLVMWQGIKLAGSKGLVFDFEGSMIAPVERFFRGFGGRLEPYSHVTHTSRRLAAALAVRDLVQALTGQRPADGLPRRASPNDPGAGPGS